MLGDQPLEVTLVGNSSQMRTLRAHIRKLANTTLPILLLGETGAGKELVARAIHQTSGRSPFVVVDCAVLVDSLAESELFGHAKGAFTGAVAAKSGLIEAAAGGTVFLDEIGELPLRLQAKLLRLLEERAFRPVGALRYQTAEFRVIAATNRDLAQCVRAATFREDLYHRISAVTLNLPTLRERPDDIPILIEHFFEQSTPLCLDKAGLDRLMSYAWPGNVRQLKHCVRCMIEVNCCRLLGTGDLECAITQSSPAAEGVPVETCRSPQPAMISLADLERDTILRVLRDEGGRRRETAQALGIGRTTLYRRLKCYQTTNVVSEPATSRSTGPGCRKHAEPEKVELGADLTRPGRAGFDLAATGWR